MRRSRSSKNQGRDDLINAIVYVDVDEDTKRRLVPSRPMPVAEWVEITRNVRPEVRVEPFPPA